MNALTCPEVREQLDLLAAGACDPPTQAALERHLEQCAACAAHYAESQRLLGLLDLRWSQNGIERLRLRIEQEAPPRRKLRLFSPFVRRAMAAAAMFLLVIGLLWWVPPWTTDRGTPEPQFALLVHTGKQPFQLDPMPPAPGRDKGVEAMAVRILAARSGDGFRRELLRAQREGKLPPPPAIDLELALVNNSKRPVEIRLGDAEPILSLDVDGPKALPLRATGGDLPEFLKPQSLHLEPGKPHMMRIDRLIAGSPGKLEYIYLTEPGEYTLTPRLRLTADGKDVIVTGQPVRIQVGE